MFIVTNREIHADKTGFAVFDDRANAKGPNELRVVEAVRTGGKWKIEVLPDQIPPARVEAEGITRQLDPATGLPKRHPATGELVPVYAGRYLAHKVKLRVNPALGGGTGTGRNLLFFVHGFNNDVKSVLERAADFEKNFGVEVVAFSWPANGGGIKGVASYKDDQRDAAASDGALDRVLQAMTGYLDEINSAHANDLLARAKLKHPANPEKWDVLVAEGMKKRCGFKVSMIAHSMGNYLFKNLLRSSIYHGGSLIFDNVCLVAADTNNEAHAEWVDAINCRGRVYVTINENDVALRASRLKTGDGQKARLGHYPFRLNSQQGVYVDFTNASGVDNSHAYFEGKALKNPAVKAFFSQAFNGEAAERGMTYDAARNLYPVP